MKADVTLRDLHLPASIQALLVDYLASPVTLGMSAARVFRLEHKAAPAMFLKIADGAAGAELRAEAERLGWLRGRAPVPRLVAYTELGAQACLLQQALPGCSATDLESAARAGAITGLAAALKTLHAQPIDDCPFDQRVAVQIERARSNVLAGRVDEDDFDNARRGRRACDLLIELERQRPQIDDLVLTHGDACLPNLIFDGERFTGFVDCGRAGVADRYQDLALIARSIAGNWGAPWVDRFFQCYGLTEPDQSRLNFFCLLDEFF